MREISKRPSGPAGRLNYGPAVHWAVKIIWEEIVSRDLCVNDVSNISGVHAKAMRQWKKGLNSPKIDNLEAVLNTVGYELRAVKRD